MYDVIIIGAGPAGLTAAIYLKRANKNVLVLEANNYGGTIIETPDIENYPGLPHISGYDFATSLYNQVKDLGCEIKFEKVLEIKNADEKEIITNKDKYLSKSVIIATGSNNRKLGLANEEELVGHGISYCATCDGNFYKNKNVMVVGGGNTAFEDALYLSDIANKVYLIHRRNTFKASEKTVDLLKRKANVQFILDSKIVKLNGNNHLESVEILHKEEKETIMIDGLFVAIGQIPNTDFISKIIDLDINGYVKDVNMHTNHRGIFVAGDVRSKQVRQLVTATSDGAIAAIEAINYLDSE